MIKIIIAVNEGKVYDQLEDIDCSFSEVSCALLRLKQIEQILIDKEFDSELESHEE